MSHFITLLCLIAAQALPQLFDASSPWQARVVAALGTVLTVAIADTTKRTKVFNTIAAAAGVAIPLATWALGYLHPGTLGVTIVTALIGVFVRLQAMRVTTAVAGFSTVAYFLGAGYFIGAQSACHNIKPDQFFNAVVDCAKVNPQASAALGQVETCLMSTIAGNPAACLSGLITDAHFAIDEVACIVAWEAQQANVKVAAGKYNADDLITRQHAVDWLAQEKIAIRNSYTPGR